MFKKLRNRMLFVNMIIISALLLGSFAVIYFITYSNARSSTLENLYQVSEFSRRMRTDNNDSKSNLPHTPPGLGPEDEHGDHYSRFRGRGDEPHARTDMMAQFVIYLDNDMNISSVQSPFEIELEAIDFDVKEIVKNLNDMGIVGYSGGYWAYLGQRSPDGYKIVFVDYTSERQILFNLLVILSFVWMAALAAAFMISLSVANKSIRPVEESYNKQKQFVTDASHELKTPLTIINTNIDVLMSHPDSTIGDEKKWLMYIKSEAERMTKLTNDLLYLAKLDHTKGKKAEIKSSMTDAAQNIILSMEAVAFEKKVAFDYEIAPEIYVNAPEEQVKQVIMILIDNAIKYTPENGEVTINLLREKNNAVLRVRNSGEGIDDEDAKRIFDRFYRSDKSRARNSGGYGLGLAIAKSICGSCGGDIEVKSEKEKYTEFTVWLKTVQ